MAGSWGHMVTEEGQLLPPGRLVQMLDNEGDWCEAAEECFGMVWWLAEVIAYRDDMDAYGSGRPPREKVLDVIKQARAGHQEGLTLGGTWGE